MIHYQERDLRDEIHQMGKYVDQQAGLDDNRTNSSENDSETPQTDGDAPTGVDTQTA